ncbi:MAG: helix-turn-helix transcriptional regulator [Micavibrio sp.]
MTITTAQIRGARGILNWSQQDLAQRTGISATSIGAIENGQTTPRESTVSTIRKTLENSGIEFIGMDGVRTKSADVRVYSGTNGFKDFYDDVYETLKVQPGTVCVSNVDENDFLNFGDDLLERHSQRIKNLGNIQYKILIREEDMNFAASGYAEYRWIAKELFTTVPFYIYGSKIAILLLGNEATAIVMNYPAIADAFRVQFEANWATARIPQEQQQGSQK